MKVICDFPKVIEIENRRKPTITRSGRQSIKPSSNNIDDYVTSGAFNNNDVVWINFINENFSIETRNLLFGNGIKKLQNTMSSMARDIIQSYKQNIISNYKTYIERYVNVLFLTGKKEELKLIDASDKSKQEKEADKTLLLKTFRNLKDDLVETDDTKYQSVNPAALQFINDNKQHVFPQKNR